MPSTVANNDSRIIKVVGAARTGKTQALIDRSAALLKQGVEPEKIMIVTSTAMAGQAARDRLKDAVGEELADKAARVVVSTPQEHCLTILKQPGAEEFTGRKPRVLNNAEYKFLQEDLRVTAATNRKVRASISYYFLQMGKMVPRDEWVLLGEEHTIIKYLDKLLKSRRALLSQEVAPFAAMFLKAPEGKAARHAYDYVLCDDYQNMDKAQQICVCMSAEKQLVVAGNPNETVVFGTTTPNPDGFTYFETSRTTDVDVVKLTEAHGNPNVAKLANSLIKHGDMNPAISATWADDKDAPKVTCVKWLSPEKEIDALTKYLRMEADNTKDLKENRTSIIVPNARWSRMLNDVLKQRGFNVTTVGTGTQLGGDPRDVDRCKAQIAYTKLCLLVDPKDIVAWRSWVGFGNFLTNSDLWAKLMDLAEEKNIGMVKALEYVSNQAREPFPKSHVLGDAYKQAQRFIGKDSKRKGFALLRSIGGDKLPEFRDIKEDLAGDETPEQMLEMFNHSFQNPEFPENPHIIRIMYPGNMTGLEADNIYVFACVDGFYPSRDAFEVVSTDERRKEIMDNERRAFYTAISKANKELYISFFSKSNLELAERSKMHVLRVKSEDGERVALLRMSQYLSESGDAYPGTTSGQQMLAQYHLD